MTELGLFGDEAVVPSWRWHRRRRVRAARPRSSAVAASIVERRCPPLHDGARASAALIGARNNGRRDADARAAAARERPLPRSPAPAAAAPPARATATRAQCGDAAAASASSALRAKTALDFALAHRGVYIKAGQFIASLQGGAGRRRRLEAHRDAPTAPRRRRGRIRGRYWAAASSFESVDEQPVAAARAGAPRASHSSRPGGRSGPRVYNRSMGAASRPVKIRLLVGTRRASGGRSRGAANDGGDDDDGSGWRSTTSHDTSRPSRLSHWRRRKPTARLRRLRLRRPSAIIAGAATHARRAYADDARRFARIGVRGEQMGQRLLCLWPLHHGLVHGDHAGQTSWRAPLAELPRLDRRSRHRLRLVTELRPALLHGVPS